MARGINVITAFLACVAAASASVALFPHGKTTVYKYRTLVKATNGEESLYASEFILQGTLDIIHDASRDPTLVNSYTIILSNLTTDMHNGKAVDYDKKSVLWSIDNETDEIELPFRIIYNPDGTSPYMKFNSRELPWTWNIKMAIAAMLQLDLRDMNEESFIKEEDTIHGICGVRYKIDKVDGVNGGFRVNKKFSPIDCASFSFKEFNNVDNDHCKTKKPEHLFTENTRDFEIEKMGGEIVIKKLVARSFVSAVSENGAPKPSVVLTNTNFELVQVRENSQIDTSVYDFAHSSRMGYLKDWDSSYSTIRPLDIAPERKDVNRFNLSNQLKKLLSDAVDYLENNHLSPTEMNWDHAQTVNKIYRTMRYMDVETLQESFDIIQDSVSPRRAVQMKNILVGVVAQVGTQAACNFTLTLIKQKKISAMAAVEMLSRLPLSVKAPTEDLLFQMQELVTLDNSIPAEVRKAGILSFASFIYRTFKNSVDPKNNEIVQEYLKNFFHHVKNENTYEMKLTYLMAIKNIEVGRIYDLLKPLIQGDPSMMEDQERFQLLSIWAIDKAVKEDYTAAIQILWPVMVNASLPLKLRIAAYEILMNQAPDEDSARIFHDRVIYKFSSDEHLLNYHWTNLESIANTGNECNVLRTTARSILNENAGIPLTARPYPLSGVHSVSYIDDNYRHAEKFDLRVTVNELTGLPEVVRFDQETVNTYGAVSDIAVQIHIEGNEDLPKILRPHFDRGLTPAKILELLEQVGKSVPARKHLKIDILVTRYGRVFVAKHYELKNLMKISEDLVRYYDLMTGTHSINHQSVVFNRLYEKKINSDIGMPIIVETRVPVVTSIKINHTNIMRRPSALDFDVEFKRWEHQDHSISVYNPFKNVWHAARAVGIHEVTLPFRANITENKFLHAVKISFPERVGSTPSPAGFLILAKHLVTVDEDRTGALFEACDTCLNQEDVHDGKRPYNANHSEYVERHFDFKYVGLNVTAYIHPGNDASLSGWNLALCANNTWDRSKFNNSQSWTGAFIQHMMDKRRQLKNIVLAGYENHRGGSLKIEPSPSNSISQIDIVIRGKYEDHDKNETTMESPHAETWKFNAELDMISSLTNKSAGLWNFDVDVDKNRGHLKNKVSVKITRKTPEEENLKICIDASKHYPAQPSDYLKVWETNQDIDSEINVSYGYNNDAECYRNETLISVKWKAQLSDEQNKRLKKDSEISSCSQEKKSPLLASPTNTVPRTIECLNEAILYTTPRKYTFNATWKLEPGTPIDHFVFEIPYDDEYGARANVKLLAEFPMETNSVEIKVVANSTIYSEANVFFRDIVRDGQGPVMRPYWDFPLDNSRFDLKFLRDYNNNEIRLCSVYPQLIMRENNPRSFSIPSDEWILISGDYFDKTFAIFAQQPRPNYLSFIIFIRDHRIHFFTRERDNHLVAVVDDIEPETEVGFRLPEGAEWRWHLKVTKNDDHFVVRMKDVPLLLRVGPNYISAIFGSELQGHVSGLCGHLNGNRFSNETDSFSIRDIETIAMDNFNEDAEN